MSNQLRHPYHLVDLSPWPLLSGMSALATTSSLVEWFFEKTTTSLVISFFSLVLVSFQWWRDVSIEGTHAGLHTGVVEKGLRWGMLLFIISEIFFFLSFFWSFFHFSLSPATEVGSSWPPSGIHPLNCFKVPLLNTLILLSSGASVTWAHHSIMGGSHSESLMGIAVTVFLGAYFTLVQMSEYIESSFSMSDGVYGSSFYLATGFHGIHVLVGTLFLIVTMARLISGSFSVVHHFGFEAASWYWHFVDLVWLFLYVSIYWWGG